MEEDRLHTELTELEDVGRVFMSLVQNGNLPSGPYVSVQEISKRIGIPVQRVTIAAMHLIQRHKQSWLDFKGTESVSAAHEYLYGKNATGVIPDSISFFIRLNTDGIEDGLKDMTIRMQVKQLHDFDRAVRRSRASIWISMLALMVSILGFGSTLLQTQENLLPSKQPAFDDQNASPAPVNDTSVTDLLK